MAHMCVYIYIYVCISLSLSLSRSLRFRFVRLKLQVWDLWLTCLGFEVATVQGARPLSIENWSFRELNPKP